MPSPLEASMRGRIGAHTKWATAPDRSAATEPARRAAATALDARLAEEFHLDSGAPDFGDRLEHARRAHFARLALKSATARRRKAGHS